MVVAKSKSEVVSPVNLRVADDPEVVAARAKVDWARGELNSAYGEAPEALPEEQIAQMLLDGETVPDIRAQEQASAKRIGEWSLAVRIAEQRERQAVGAAERRVRVEIEKRSQALARRMLAALNNLAEVAAAIRNEREVVAASGVSVQLPWIGNVDPRTVSVTDGTLEVVKTWASECHHHGLLTADEARTTGAWIAPK